MSQTDVSELAPSAALPPNEMRYGVTIVSNGLLVARSKEYSSSFTSRESTNVQQSLKDKNN
eukprot:3435635-Amphidinium_carterae.1